MGAKERVVGFANLFCGELTLPDGEEIKFRLDDFFEGNLYRDSVLHYLTSPLANSKFRKNEEEEACKNFYELVKKEDNPYIPKYLILDDLNETEYSVEDDTILLSKKVKKFCLMFEHSDLHQTLCMNLIRGIGLRMAYANPKYYKLFLDKIKKFPNFKVDEYNSVCFSIDVTEKEWNALARMEFMREMVAWKYAFDILQSGNVFGDANINHDDFKKLMKYSISLSISKLHDFKLNKTPLRLYNGAMTFKLK